MLTPQEVGERAFNKVSFGGYNMSQVDEFLDILTGDYSALYTENAVLKSKMKVLVDSVEEYRSTEEAMRKALMSAQRMADEMLREAEASKRTILAEAEELARQKVASVRQDRETEELRLAEAQRATAQFVAEAKAIYEKGAEFLDTLAERCPQPEPSAVQEELVEETANEVEESVQRILAQAMADAKAYQSESMEDNYLQEGDDEEEYEEEGDDHPYFDTQKLPTEDDLLQFGQDYVIR